jgi:electron transfer flavoprotein alpha subunit
LVAATSPRHVLFSETEIGGELGRRVAAHLDEWPATDVIRLSGGTATALQDRGRSEVVRPAPMILILAPRSFDPVSATPRREGRPIEIPVFEASGGTREAGLLPVDPAGIPLREADLIIGAGQGVRDWNSFHAVARALEAAEGGTRVVCDNGHLPRERQIGASGTHVAPRCYLALGISGASQHLAGIVESRHVIAINVDPDCDMVRRADLAVIADAQPVMTALLRYLEGSK